MRQSDDVVPLSRVSRFRESFRASRIHHVKIGCEADMKKLGRNLSGKSIAVVLGGHAEGDLQKYAGVCGVVLTNKQTKKGVSCFAYLGVLTAFQHHNVPIDILGGSFNGAMVAALFALEMSPVSL